MSANQGLPLQKSAKNPVENTHSFRTTFPADFARNFGKTRAAKGAALSHAPERSTNSNFASHVGVYMPATSLDVDGVGRTNTSQCGPRTRHTYKKMIYPALLPYMARPWVERREFRAVGSTAQFISKSKYRYKLSINKINN